jgi:TolB-like protein/class 3 adenylate cyclase
MTATRKLAAILAADVAGYSRLTGADEEGTLARIRALRAEIVDPALGAHRGRVANTAGDSLLVEFASAVDAVRAGIAIQRETALRNADFPADRRIEFRIGIHVGDVMVEPDGDLRGDGVNIAARLERIAASGGICLSEDAYRQVKGRVEAGFTALGEQKLRNIADPVRAFALTEGKAAPASAAPKRRVLLASMAVAFALLMLGAAGAWYLYVGKRPANVAKTAPVASNAAAPTEARHLSIVVLPFTNLSGDPGQDYFADGVTENITTELSRIKNSFVIARNTAFTYKGKSVDAKLIGKELGVRYVLEGSVQREENRVRVNAQLIDAESGAHLWADSFDEDLADLFKLQDELVARLARSLDLALTKAEATKGSRAGNPDVIDLSLQGWSLIWRGFQQPSTERQRSVYEARRLFDEALKIDPDDPDAQAGSAYTYAHDYIQGWTAPPTDYEAKVLAQVNRAIAQDPDNVRAYFVKAVFLSTSRRYLEAIAAADAGLAVDPNFAPLLSPKINAENSLGKFEQGKADAERAMTRLSRRDPYMGRFQVEVGDAELSLGHLDAAIAEYQKAIDSGLSTYYAHSNLAAAYAQAGRMEEAKAALSDARRLNPNLTVKWMTDHMPNLPAVFDGVRKAGLAEE